MRFIPLNIKGKQTVASADPKPKTLTKTVKKEYSKAYHKVYKAKTDAGVGPDAAKKCARIAGRKAAATIPSSKAYHQVFKTKTDGGMKPDAAKKVAMIAGRKAVATIRV